MAALQSEILLNSLKEVAVKLQSSRKQPITDGDSSLARLCHGIEFVFRQGLKKSVFGIKKWDYWCWIEALVNHVHSDRQQLSFVHAVSTTKSCKKLLTSQGFGRLFIRTALKKRLLSHTVRLLHHNKPLLKARYADSSVICDKVLRDIFMEILAELDKHVFDLDLKNSSYLDETWIIPDVRRVDIVPCKELGLIIRNVNKKVMVAVVKPYSTAYDAEIEIGDTLDELMGISVHNMKTNKVTAILKQNSGRPVLCTIVKGKLPNGSIFPPVAERMAVISVDPYQEIGSRSPNKEGPQQLVGLEETAVHSSDTAACYPAIYYGRLDVGQDGGVAVIEDSIFEVLKKSMPPKSVYLNLTETKIFVNDQETSKVLLIHSFTETSSCGRRSDRKEIIAFVSGETTCSLARKFYCYVFQMATEEMLRNFNLIFWLAAFHNSQSKKSCVSSEAKVVLYSIADGFVRTVWFV